MPRSSLIVLMFIGGSPGSTAGGIKTTSFALLLLMMWNRWRGSEEVTVSNRTVPKELIGRTLSITFASMLSVFFIVAVVMVAGHVESGPQERQLFVEYIFETVRPSAPWASPWGSRRSSPTSRSR